MNTVDSLALAAGNKVMCGILRRMHENGEIKADDTAVSIDMAAVAPDTRINPFVVAAAIRDSASDVSGMFAGAFCAVDACFVPTILPAMISMMALATQNGITDMQAISRLMCVNSVVLGMALQQRLDKETA